MIEPLAEPTVEPTGGPTTVVESTCPLDCPDACSLEIRVQDGKVIKLDGSRRNPVTEGYICSKVRKFPELMYGPDRLLHPLRRTGAKGAGEFVRVSWDEALGEIAARLVDVRDRFGGEAILPYCYGGSNGLLTQDTTDALLFRRLGALRLARTVCAAATGAATVGLYGKMPGVAYPDFPLARLIVVWGANPSASGIHLVPRIQEARANGARMIVVDPRRTPLAKQADLHLAIRPGTDLPVALSIHRWLFSTGKADRAFLAAHATGVEELARRAEPWTFARAAALAGVEAAGIEQLAEWYAEASPALIRCGWGLERNRNGGSAVAAVIALPAVAGKFGVRGGGYTLSNSGAWKLSADSVVDSPESPTRVLNMNRLGEALTDASDQAIRILFVYNSNALVTTPDQERIRRGLERDDLFTVVFDQVRTDTALYADVVLPATTFLEHHELSRGYGAYVLQQGDPVVAPVGEARSNYAVFAELATLTGVARADEIPAPETARRRILESTGRGEELEASLASEGMALPLSGERPIQFVDVFPRTSDRKVHLVPPALDAEAPEGLYGYQSDPATAEFPLMLISPATNRTVSSTFGQLRRGKVPLAMHPGDAEARRLRTGDRVRVWNELGEVHTTVAVTTELRPGVVELPKGLWAKHTDNGRTANALAPTTLTDLGAGATFNDARVQVERR